MTRPAFTLRNVTKFTVRNIIFLETAELTSDAVTDYTSFDEDDLVVRIGSKIVGWYVAEKVRPVTDKMVDVTFDFVAAKRDARAAKKSTETEK